MIHSDLHIHIFMNGYDYKKAVQDNRYGVDEAHVREVLSSYRDAGFTLLREGGDHYGASIYAKEIASDFGITYLSPVFGTYKKGLYGSVVGRSWETFSDFRALVEEAKAKGCDFIKIMSTGILDFDRFGVVSKGALTYEELREIVNIAHGEGFKVMSHTNGNENIVNAARAGVDSIEHGYYAGNEAIQAIVETKTVWVPTAVTSWNLQKSNRFDAENVRRIAHDHISNVMKGIDAGANIGVGSDAGAFMVGHVTGALGEYELITTTYRGDKDIDGILVSTERLIAGWADR